MSAQPTALVTCAALSATSSSSAPVLLGKAPQLSPHGDEFVNVAFQRHHALGGDATAKTGTQLRIPFGKPVPPSKCELVRAPAHLSPHTGVI